MEDVGALAWTADQWALLQRTAADAARRARTVATFLPLVGPLPAGQASVPALEMRVEPPAEAYWGTGADRMQVDDGKTLELTTLSCEVFVTTQQANDPALASVQQMVARAAVVIARLEDAIAFRGQPGPSQAPENPGLPDIYRVQGGQENKGLLTANDDVQPVGDEKAAIVAAVMDAVSALEGRGHYGPFGCVLGDALYAAAHEPSKNSFVLPTERIVPFLGGGLLLRSSVVPPNEGVVVATAGAPIDLVVASDLHVGYVQRSTEPRYVLRVSERIVLRLKQPDAVVRLRKP
jgi:uncharacterized linocin/CFP29 family protein